MGLKFVAERDLGDPVIITHRYYFSWIKPYVSKKKILDIGCWTGPMEHLLEKEDCDVTAIDIEEEPLKVARKRFPKMKFLKASIVDDTPLKRNQFDIALFLMVIEHIPKGTETQALKNINRVLKKGGNLFLTTMNSNLLSNLTDPAYFLVGHRHYSREHLTRLLEKAGFKVEEVRYNGGFYTIFYTWLLYFFKHILRRNEPRGKFVQKLMSLNYKNKGLTEIGIRAVKV